MSRKRDRTHEVKPVHDAMMIDSDSLELEARTGGLPPEIWAMVLSFVTTLPDQLDCSTVCRLWRSLIWSSVVHVDWRADIRTRSGADYKRWQELSTKPYLHFLLANVHQAQTLILEGLLLDGDDFMMLTYFTSLRKLDLSRQEGCYLGPDIDLLHDDHLALLAASLTCLTKLSIFERQQVSGTGLAGFTGLRSLNIGLNKMSVAGYQVLTNMTNLRHLNVRLGNTACPWRCTEFQIDGRPGQVHTFAAPIAQ
eukprot:TRINITY_DN6637_c0_g1_i3.p1 TRINITY_DN6637_c0_g1~~TRINITY_DN6637_c0_g1_i3.p1  ORF type:complete len:252 (+),score=26.00 TRINITY_DN6637_c0_g1_i3:81-836(+)